MKKSAWLIPKGQYCYSIGKEERFVMCPYWSIRKDKPEQMNGYCHYLEKGDWQMKMVGKWYRADGTPLPDIEAKDMPPMYGLIWDQVKECQINMDD